MSDSTGTTEYSYYNSIARLRDIVYPDGTMLDFSYDVQSLTQRYIEFDSLIMYEYDERNRIDTMLLYGHDYAVGNDWYVYLAGQIEQTYNQDSSYAGMSINDGVINKQFNYDGLNLASLTYVRDDQFVIGSYQYNYDNNRNIIQQNENGLAENYTYDALNRIETSSLFNETYTYDQRDNRQTLSSTQPPNIQTASYEYNDRNELTQVTTSEGQVVNYRYNGDGLLYERIEDGVTTRYYYDEQQRLFREGIVLADDSIHLTARYIYDEQTGSLLARHDVTSNVVLYYIQNRKGDITHIVDGAGNIVNEYTYDIWGNPLTTSELLETPFRYSGEYWDSTTGLQYLRARWYDPSVGRFINEDPYQGDMTNPLSQNRYSYVHNNPLIYVDPSGYRPMYVYDKKHERYFYIYSSKGRDIAENAAGLIPFGDAFTWFGRNVTNVLRETHAYHFITEKDIYSVLTSEEFGIVLSTAEHGSKYAKASSNLKSIGKFAGYFGNVISAHQLVTTISQYDDMDRLIHDLVWDSNLSSNSKEELILRYSYISVYLSNLIESEYLEYSYAKGELQHNLSSDESIALNRRLRDNLKKIINK